MNPKPAEVFTPRSDRVNHSMYVNRPDQEKSLKRALDGTNHIVIHGESGTGKSWLCKKMLYDRNAHYESANMANAVRLKGLNNEFDNLLGRLEKSKKVGYTEKKDAGLNLGVGKGGISHSGEYAYGTKEPFEALISQIRKTAKKQEAFLIIDNFEAAIGNQQLIEEIANCIILLDDQRYAQYRVRIIIIGTPSDVREYFKTISNPQPVINRLRVIPEVERLLKFQTEWLVEQGMFNILKYNYKSTGYKSQFIANITWITDRIPQYVQECCLDMALEAEGNGGMIDEHVYNQGGKEWVRSCMLTQYDAISNNMNSRQTKVGRRNQVIYTLCHMELSDFSSAQVEAELRKLFPVSCKGKTLNVSQILAELADPKHGLVRASANNSKYRFRDPRTQLVGRFTLSSTEKDQTVKIMNYRDFH